MGYGGPVGRVPKAVGLLMGGQTVRRYHSRVSRIGSWDGLDLFKVGMKQNRERERLHCILYIANTTIPLFVLVINRSFTAICHYFVASLTCLFHCLRYKRHLATEHGIQLKEGSLTEDRWTRVLLCLHHSRHSNPSSFEDGSGYEISMKRRKSIMR